jgi:peptidoglycan/xylan/chitin deacetylase (PgdA/CDA1 family)
MRAARHLILTVLGAAGIALAAWAPAYAGQDTCPAGTLGVSRVIDVDTTGGPWFGRPHGDPSFLAPKEVVLTFDDGPSPTDTRKILAALAKECTKATFFVVGEMVALHPEIVKEVAEQGHTIGIHSWSHPNLARLPLKDVEQEVEATFDAAQKASPEPIAPFFRYPYLSSSKTTVDYMKSRNIGQFAVDVDSQDWRVRSSKPVIQRIMAGLKSRGRGIILMHDIHKWTADALPTLLTQLKAGGYKVVQLKAKTPLQLIADVSPPVKTARKAQTRSTHKRSKATAWKLKHRNRVAQQVRKPSA